MFPFSAAIGALLFCCCLLVYFVLFCFNNELSLVIGITIGIRITAMGVCAPHSQCVYIFHFILFFSLFIVIFFFCDWMVMKDFKTKKKCCLVILRI